MKVCIAVLVSVLAFSSFAAQTPNESTTPQDIPSAQVYYANKYNISLAKLIKLAQCESGNKQNYEDGYPVLGQAGEVGIYQYKTLTFYSYARKMGLENPNILDPVQQVEITAWAINAGHQKAWTCWNKI